MHKNYNPKTNKRRFSKKRVLADQERLKQFSFECANGAVPASTPLKRYGKGITKVAEPIKKRRAEARAPTTEIPSPDELEVEEEVEQENQQQQSKHYKEQQSLFNDWYLKKDTLINRYFMSFADGHRPDPRQVTTPAALQCTTCLDIEETSVTVYFLNRHCIMKVKHCNCCSLAEALVQLQLMPKTIKSPRTAVHFGLLDFFQQLESSSQVSSGAMASVLNWMNAKDESIQLSEATLNDTRVCYQRFVLYAKQHLFEELGVNQVLDVCLPCEASNIYEYMMDANFSLKRLARKEELVAYRVTEEERIWVEQNEVEEAGIEERLFKQAEKKNGVACSSEVVKDSVIKAAHGASRSGRAGYAVNGIFAVLCRHGMVNKLADVVAGETHSLALACVKKAVAQNVCLKPYNITYDIMCRIKNSVKRLIPSEVAAQSQFALPVLHCYGHQMHCQMEYSPRYLPGFGLTDGEGIERFWSYLGEFTKLTRGMTKSNRKMTLLTASKHYGAEKMASVGEQLYDHYLKAMDVISKANEDLGDEDVDELMEVWSTVRASLTDGVSTVSSLGNGYNAYCIRLLDAEREAEEEDDDEARAVIETKLLRYKKMVVELERKSRAAGAVVVRPTWASPCIVRLRSLLAEEKKSESLLHVFTSLYVIKALRPLIKGRKGKAGVQMAQRLNGQILKERAKAKAAIVEFNKIVQREEQDELRRSD